MTSLRWPRLVAAAVAAVMLASPAANAAFITIDDSNPSSIKITAGDFERGFSVDGNLLTTGLGQSGSITLPDAAHTISGSWIDLGHTANPTTVQVLYALPGNPTGVTSGVKLTATTDGFFGSLNGTFYGFNGGTYFTDSPAFSQINGGTQGFDLPFLSGSFTPEAVPVPAPASLTLLGCAVPFVAALRRRRAGATA